MNILTHSIVSVRFYHTCEQLKGLSCGAVREPLKYHIAAE